MSKRARTSSSTDVVQIEALEFAPKKDLPMNVIGTDGKKYIVDEYVTTSEEEEEEEEGYRQFNEEYFGQLFEHEKMLADKKRMHFYYKLIQDNVPRGATVLDVGTGTGVLAAWASKKVGQEGTVYAIDHSNKCLAMAATLAQANACKNVQFFQCHSSQFKSPDTKNPGVDVILHEQIGDVLFDEDIVRTITDLRERCLRPGGLILPAYFRLHIEPVELDTVRHVPMISGLQNAPQTHGLDFSCLIQNHLKSQNDDPNYHHFRSSDASLVKKLLSSPALGLPGLDVNLFEDSEETLGKEYRDKRVVREHSDFRFDAFCVWFTVREQNGSERSTSSDGDLHNGPFADRAPHWGFRLLRVKGATMSMGDVLEFVVRIGDQDSWQDLNQWRWEWNVIPNRTE